MHAPKAYGAWHVHGATACAALEWAVHFSSVAACFGNVGQASYATANAYLDSLALGRRAHGAAACSLQLPLVAGAGMGAATLDERQMREMAAVSLEEYAACLDAALGAAGAEARVVRAVLPWSPERVSRSVPDASQPVFAEVARASASGGEGASTAGVAAASEWAREVSRVSASRRGAHVEAQVVAVVRELSGEAGVGAGTPLMEAGVDSLAATELAGRLRELTGLALSPTLVFEQPTPRAIAAHVLEQLGVTAAEAVGGVVGGAPGVGGTGASSSVWVGGAAARWPGCGVGRRGASWSLACSGGDAVVAVPSARWSLERVVDVSSLSAETVACAAHGGFVRGAARFDGGFFGVSPAEAGAMEPQQRLLLELGYEALHGAGGRRATALGSDAGVFVGLERPDWALLQALSAGSGRSSVYAVTGDNVSIAAGRLSFALGLQGPCATVDTACSSALVALHGASLALRGGECGSALAAAVSLKLLPHGTLGAASAGMLSVDGRCKTFDARANGYVRSEGVGALLLRPRPSSGRGAPVDRAVVGGSAVRQDGRSASLTAPNGSAQRVLLLAAHASAAEGAAAFGLALVEAHGTGTPLGDPTEAGALAAAVGGGGAASVLVGAAKGSVGHAEAASGLLGLLRAADALERACASANAQLRAVNPLVAERARAARRVALALCAQRCGAAAGVGGMCGGVSSFGFSGTIARATAFRAFIPLCCGATPPPTLLPWSVPLGLARQSTLSASLERHTNSVSLPAAWAALLTRCRSHYSRGGCVSGRRLPRDDACCSGGRSSCRKQRDVAGDLLLAAPCPISGRLC